jgi:hypothetical protein
MPPSFLERHAADILGAYSCFDQIIIQGTLPDIAHADAMTQEMVVIPLLCGYLLPAGS